MPDEEEELPDQLEEDGEHLTEEEEEFPAGEERPRFNWWQRLSIGSAIFLAFLLGMILFFPTDTIVRYAIGRYSRQLLLDFRHIDLNMLGPDVLNDVWMATPDNYGLKAQKIEVGLGRWGLLHTAPKGSLVLHGVELSLDEFTLSLDKIQIEMDLNDLSRPPSEWRGMVAIKTAGRIRVLSLPETIKGISLNLKPEKLQIRNLVLQAKSNRGEKGVFQFNGSTLKSNLADVSIDGNGQIGKSLATMRLNSKLCLKVDPGLEKQNRLLYQVYTMQGGRPGEKFCFDLKGSLNRPQFLPIRANPPSMPGDSPSPPSGEPSPAGPAPAKPAGDPTPQSEKLNRKTPQLREAKP